MAAIAFRPFVCVDVAIIKASVKASGEKPTKGDVRQLDAPSVDDQECKRVYAYKNRNWHYTGTLNTVTNTMFDAPVAEKSDSEHSDNASDAADATDATHATDAKPKKARKPRAPKAQKNAVDGSSLVNVLAAIDALQIAEAKDMLRSLIEGGGVVAVNAVKAKKGKKSKSDSDSADGAEKPKRKLSDYTLFLQAEMLKIRQTEPDVKSKDVMRQAMLRWKAHKEANGIVTVADKKAAAVAVETVEAVAV